MREESHLEEMRSAIRGDFERLAQRRGDQELLRVGEEPSDAAGDEPEIAESPPEPEPELQAEVDQAPRVEPQPEPEPEPEPGPDPEPEPEPRRSWLSRFLSP